MTRVKNLAGLIHDALSKKRSALQKIQKTLQLTKNILFAAGFTRKVKKMKILEAISLKKYFPIRSGVFLQVCGNVKALEKADIQIEQGQTIGVVGESGCGKSTLGKLLLKLYDPTDGKIIYTDKENNSYDITSKISKTVASKFRRDVQMIFQNPFDSLDRPLS